MLFLNAMNCSVKSTLTILSVQLMNKSSISRISTTSIALVLLAISCGYVPALAQSGTTSTIVEDGGTGAYKAIMISDNSLPAHTVFRPSDLSVFDENSRLPVIAWGNGACANTPDEHKNFLSEVSSHGFLIVAIGKPLPEDGERPRQRTTSSQLIDAIDWAFEQNEKTDSPYYKKIDTSEVSVSGMSCGGLQTLEVADDPRITTVGVFNSGILPTSDGGMPGMPAVEKSQLEKLRVPTIYMLGGESDIAYNNGMDDFDRIDHVPVFVANLDVGHGGTYREPHGGEYSKVATAWYQWQLKDDQEAAKMFTGESPGIANLEGWVYDRKNID